MASVGSVNFDNRCFAINFEMTRVDARRRRSIAASRQCCCDDFEDCREVTREEVQQRGALRAFRQQAAKLFSPIL